MANAQYAVYISCVGEQDPVSEKTGVEGPLLTCLRYLKDVKNVRCHTACLIPTSRKTIPQRHTERRAKECKRHLVQIDDQLNVKIKPLTVQNPADLKQVYPKMRELLKSIVQEVEQEAQGKSLVFHLNVSSGTPQMKESLPFLVSTGQLSPHIAHLWQIFDPRGGFGRLHQRVQPAPQMDLLTQERLLLRMEQLAKQFLYQETNGLLQTSLTMEHLEFAQKLYRILTNHDQWQYEQARKQLQELLKDQNEGQSFRDWLSKVLAWLKELAKRNPPKDKLAIDRHFCAYRRLIQGLYADAISHFWTACELALEVHGASIGLPRKSRESAWEFINRIKANSNSVLKQREIQLPNESPKSLIDSVNWLRITRNKVEHGTSPVTEQLAENAKLITEAVFEALQWSQQLSDYPLHPEQVRECLLSLIQDMRESLWSRASTDSGLQEPSG